MLNKNSSNNRIKIILSNKNSLFVCFVILFSFFGCFNISHAATEIYFESNVKEIKENKESKEIFVGDIFSVNLKVSSADKEINAIDGTILYDKDKLEIEKVKTDNSVFSFWAEEPSFNNKIGELSFVGGVPNGFSEKNGQVLEITFLAKKSGKTSVGYQDIFSVFANDGQGTVINPWLKPLTVEIQKKSFFSKINIFNNNARNIFRNNQIVLVLVVLFIIIKILIYIRNKNKRREK